MLWISFVLLVWAFENSHAHLGLLEGEICKQERKSTWNCRKLSECPEIEDFKTSKPLICSFDDKLPIVCCPNSARRSTGESIIRCVKYQLRACKEKLGVSNTSRRVRRQFLESFPVSFKSISQNHPHMALLGYGNERAKQWICGGTLVSEWFVLSSAHCARLNKVGEAKWIRLGDIDAYQIEAPVDISNTLELDISEIVLHPLYDKQKLYNNIALYRLSREVAFNDHIKPACLYPYEEITTDKATGAWWGKVDSIESINNQLLEADLHLVNQDVCKSQYNSSVRLPNGIESKSMLCAEQENGKQSCSGGNPLEIENQGSCLKYVIGITSFGKGCGMSNIPSVYTKVSYYVHWIEKVIWPQANQQG